MDWFDPLSSLLSVLTMAVALGAVFHRPMQRLGRVLRAIEGEPKVPGLIEQVKSNNIALALRLTEQDKKLETIQHQVLPNGGQSMRDDIGKIGASCARTEALASSATT